MRYLVYPAVSHPAASGKAWEGKTISILLFMCCVPIIYLSTVRTPVPPLPEVRSR